ncbi:hypothetical protein GXW83_23475 [Streptacidiphilus sp. PB12-B1b]|uniref:phosphatase domain-containing protein n=1 Tax=Streptacidiphilus sp. PB12-B1b TaxID=2705012 RepID=UPI0015F8152C|nr:hypothetical protein [Streptacidiphilus sp. PB12-B1b]QMU78221.1 hypothetical protein GXW83_23475 [Streptacidiphilus sp. PB12-B1b]
MTRTRPAWAVFDIDGVVADVAHRVPHLSATPPDWEAFFARAAGDTPLPQGVDRVAEARRTHEVVWFTGRPERIRATTTAWLTAQGLPAGRLYMRPDDDDSPASALKAGWLRELARLRQVALVVEDDDAVVAVLRAAGWPVEQARWAASSAPLHTAQERWGRT